MRRTSEQKWVDPQKCGVLLADNLYDLVLTRPAQSHNAKDVNFIFGSDDFPLTWGRKSSLVSHLTQQKRS
jgi:hypothetical protein